MSNKLVYVHDPMCSWCYGFDNTRRQIFDALEGRLPIETLLGGLAPDSDEPMSEGTRSMIRQAWQRIEQMIPGTRFNYEFWDKNQPRRSTYPSNRAVIAARRQGEDYAARMTARIQQAYYREARNPSDDEVLIELADEIGLDAESFAEDLADETTQQELIEEISRSRAIGIDSFPSLAVVGDNGIRHIGLDYNNPQAMLTQIEDAAGI